MGSYIVPSSQVATSLVPAITSGKMLEDVMVNSTTPIFRVLHGSCVVVGTGFFYRNLAPPPKTSLTISLPLVNWPDILRDFRQSLKNLMKWATFFVRKYLITPISAYLKNCNNPTSPEKPQTYLITVKSMFSQVETAEADDLGWYMFSYRRSMGSNRSLIGRFRHEDLVRHPSEDIAAVDVTSLLQQVDDEICCLTSSHIRADQNLAEQFGIAERVTLYGFCYDFCSDGRQTWLEEYPTERGGFTAFPPGRDFLGKRQGVVSMMTYSGFDCGAPLLLRRGNGKSVFLGVLQQWHSSTEALTEKKNSNQKDGKMILGKYIKASLLLEISTWLSDT